LGPASASRSASSAYGHLGHPKEAAAPVEASLVRGLEEGALAEEIARLQHDEQDEYAFGGGHGEDVRRRAGRE
jgi:hypothetical protein